MTEYTSKELKSLAQEVLEQERANRTGHKVWLEEYTLILGDGCPTLRVEMIARTARTNNIEDCYYPILHNIAI